MSRTFAAALLLAAAACTEPELGSRSDEVIGGRVTPAGMYPGVGALLYDLGGGRPEAGCTGTLIAPTVVLTAAHCVDPALGGDSLVGFTLVQDTVSTVPAFTATAGALKHEQFDVFREPDPGLTQWFDIGLLFLAAPITEVAPVRLPRPIDAPLLAADGDLTIVGYGRTSNDSNAIGVMHDAPTKLVSLNQWELQVAGGGGQPQNCHGDSGGPALAELGGTRTVGVVSRSFDLSPNCLNGGIDTRVDAYLDWIWANLPEGTAMPCGSGLGEPCPDEDDGGGCCSTSREAPAGSLVAAALVLGALVRRRRR